MITILVIRVGSFLLTSTGKSEKVQHFWQPESQIGSIFLKNGYNLYSLFGFGAVCFVEVGLTLTTLLQLSLFIPKLPIMFKNIKRNLCRIFTGTFQVRVCEHFV